MYGFRFSHCCADHTVSSSKSLFSLLFGSRGAITFAAVARVVPEGRVGEFTAVGRASSPAGIKIMFQRF